MSRVIEQTASPAKSGKKAAIFSLIAPLIAVGLNIVATTALMKYSVHRPLLAAGALIAIWAGLLSAIVGLIRGLGSFSIRAILYALTGLLLNAGLLALACGVMPGFKGPAEHPSKTTLLQLNSMPQVFENSIAVFNQRYGFRLELPAGFVNNPDSASATKAIHSFVRYDNNGRPNVFVNIERLRKILAPRNDKPSVEQLEEFKRVMRKSSPYAVLDKIEQEQWKSHTLDVFLVEMPDKGEMISLWIVQVPLSGEAIQIQVSGLKGGEGQYRQVLRQILKSLQGNSNWD